MTNKEADSLRKSFEESNLFAYYEKYGDKWAVSNMSRSFHTSKRYKNLSEKEQLKIQKRFRDIVTKWRKENPEVALQQSLDAFELARTIEHQSDAGKIGGAKTKEKGLGIFNIPHEEMQEYRMLGLETQREQGIGFFRERTKEENEQNALRSKKRFEENPELGKQLADSAKKWRKENPEESARIQKENAIKGSATRKLRGDFETEEHKAKWQKAINSAQEAVACPNCGKTGNKVNMKRWHFDNCKLQKPFELMPSNKRLTKKQILKIFKSKGFDMTEKELSRFIAKHPKMSMYGKKRPGANGKNAAKYYKKK